MKMAGTKEKRLMLIALGCLVALFLAGGGYAFTVYHSISKATDKMHTPIKRVKSPKRIELVTLEKQQPISVLLLGVDEREGDRGRTDSMIVLTINPSLGSVKMVSIPRDTRTVIAGRGAEDKINHAYAFGGVEMAMETVEGFLDIPIDYYVKVNMEGFSGLVDAVGGVTVTNPFEFTYGEDLFSKGEITLDGESALNYSRMRYEDPRGDFGRQERQRAIIKAVLDKGASLPSLANFDKIFAELGRSIKTNLSFEQMVGIARNYKDAAKNIEQLELNGTGTKINAIYYYLVTDEERQRVQAELKQHLEL
ncbi:LytR family transcriptional regulator [Neobacillus piezotolerans]|uniref:Polyisoprenyl-teichoic acid--peptidoglycan teichoic acid transferase TagU n=1 Tax=Neobacillus piezotolerans TaxID=2259171 RepID=A0A3D8GRX3_9BACI|nr:LytR family transcriptional regulator [Neobacillus piezotolerans]RDU37233.1 LytR family transcriptional regulator [Neobacillus piezotolerans]